MTASNHVLTGSVIAAAIGQPFVALPLAFLSHFALDSFPHFDIPGSQHTSRKFMYVLFSDMTVASIILLGLLILQPHDWPLLIAGGILGASPDLMWLPRWVNELRNRPNKPKGPIARFHSRIQTRAHPDRWPVEIVWFIVVGILLISIA